MHVIKELKQHKNKFHSCWTIGKSQWVRRRLKLLPLFSMTHNIFLRRFIRYTSLVPLSRYLDMQARESIFLDIEFMCEFAVSESYVGGKLIFTLIAYSDKGSQPYWHAKLEKYVAFFNPLCRSIQTELMATNLDSLPCCAMLFMLMDLKDSNKFLSMYSIISFFMPSSPRFCLEIGLYAGQKDNVNKNPTQEWMEMK